METLSALLLRRKPDKSFSLLGRCLTDPEPKKMPIVWKDGLADARGEKIRIGYSGFFLCFLENGARILET